MKRVKEEHARADEQRRTKNTNFDVESVGEDGNGARQDASNRPNGRVGTKVVRQLSRAIRRLASMPPAEQVVAELSAEGALDIEVLGRGRGRGRAIAWLEELAEVAMDAAPSESCAEAKNAGRPPEAA